MNYYRRIKMAIIEVQELLRPRKEEVRKLNKYHYLSLDKKKGKRKW